MNKNDFSVEHGKNLSLFFVCLYFILLGKVVRDEVFKTLGSIEEQNDRSPLKLINIGVVKFLLRHL